jgi:hypothetical protein
MFISFLELFVCEFPMTYKSEVKSDKSYDLCKDDPTFIKWKEALE